MRVRVPILLPLALALAVAGYVVGLRTGAVALVGYDSQAAEQHGFSSTRWFPIRLSMPVWLDAGSAVRADYDVRAAFGSASLDVAPPLVLRTSLQVATVHISGRRAGSVLFVAQSPGWYHLRASPSPLGGPRCPRERSMAEVMIGSRDCPTYEVSYSVAWRLADPRTAPPGTARIVIPRPGEKLTSLHIGN